MEGPEIKPSSNSIPPKQKGEISKLSLITHTIVDLAAIISITIFVIVGKLDARYGVGLIAIIAGVWLNSNSNGKAPPNGPSAILGTIIGIGKFLYMWGRA